MAISLPTPSSDTAKKRAACASELVPQIRAALLAQSALEWEEIFGDRVPCCAVRPIEDMFDHPQVLAEDLVTHFDHPEVGGYRGLTRSLSFSATPGPLPFAAPGLGQHTGEVLARYGYSEAEIEELRQKGVIPAARSLKGTES